MTTFLGTPAQQHSHASMYALCYRYSAEHNARVGTPDEHQHTLEFQEDLADQLDVLRESHGQDVVDEFLGALCDVAQDHEETYDADTLEYMTEQARSAYDARRAAALDYPWLPIPHIDGDVTTPYTRKMRELEEELHKTVLESNKGEDE
tara:strand:- start:89 stop:535 length:447 start_codon:yes stop_codon:yes gene_type:complete